MPGWRSPPGSAAAAHASCWCRRMTLRRTCATTTTSTPRATDSNSRLLARLPLAPPRGPARRATASGSGDPLRRATRLRQSLVQRRTKSLARLDALLELLGPKWLEAFRSRPRQQDPAAFPCSRLRLPRHGETARPDAASGASCTVTPTAGGARSRPRYCSPRRRKRSRSGRTPSTSTSSPRTSRSRPGSPSPSQTRSRRSTSALRSTLRGGRPRGDPHLGAGHRSRHRSPDPRPPRRSQPLPLPRRRALLQRARAVAQRLRRKRPPRPPDAVAGTPQLREAIFIAADHARRIDPTLAARYQRLMVLAGKHHNSALCHVRPRRCSRASSPAGGAASTTSSATATASPSPWPRGGASSPSATASRPRSDGSAWAPRVSTRKGTGRRGQESHSAPDRRPVRCLRYNGPRWGLTSASELNGPELTANALRDWCRFSGTGSSYIEPGTPWENPYVESFNGRLRDEFLAVEQFDSLLEAQVLIEDWRIEYNTKRPHSSLGWLAPAAYAEQRRAEQLVGLSEAVVSRRGSGHRGLLTT